MKAKDYYKRICETRKEDIDTVINQICADMINDIKDLIKVRHITKDHDKFKVLKEVNKKWEALLRLADKIDFKHAFGRELGMDEFILYIHKNDPDLNRFIRIQEVDENGNITEPKKEEKPPMYIHKVIPLEEITNDNITGEILNCMYAVGGYSSAGIPLKWMKPLVYRISLLEHWKLKGINYDHVVEFEKNPEKFVFDVIKPVFV